MSTRSTIAVQKGNKVSVIYCHWDGYIDYVGKMLALYYNTFEKAEQLVALGDISSLDKSTECPAGHTWEHAVSGCTVAYCRDRGDAYAVQVVDIDDYEKFGFNYQDYNYLFRDGKWWMRNNVNDPYVDITRHFKIV